MKIHKHRSSLENKRKTEQGSALLEVVVAISILAIGLLAVASMQVAAIRGNSFAGNVTEGTCLASDRLEKLMSQTYDHADLTAGICSGSFPTSGMIVLPCSMGTLGRIATGVSTNIIERAADVTLKERRPLILVPRETPLNLIHLRNMTTVTEAGGIIMPPMPQFYHGPASIDDLVTAFVGRLLDQLGLPNRLVPRWTEDTSQEVLKKEAFGE